MFQIFIVKLKNQATKKKSQNQPRKQKFDTIRLKGMSNVRGEGNEQRVLIKTKSIFKALSTGDCFSSKGLWFHGVK